MEIFHENVIEWLSEDKTAAITAAARGGIKARLMKLAERYPEQCTVDYINKDGSILAHIPKAWIKISPPKRVELSEERREELSKRMKDMRARQLGRELNRQT